MVSELVLNLKKKKHKDYATVYIKGIFVAFAEFRKATVSFVMSVRQSVCPWNISSLDGQIFKKFDIWVFFKNLSKKLKFP